MDIFKTQSLSGTGLLRVLCHWLWKQI